MDQEELKITMDRLHEERYNQLEAKMKAHQEMAIKLEQERHSKEVETLKEQHKQHLAKYRNEIEAVKRQHKLEIPQLATGFESMQLSNSNYGVVQKLNGHQSPVQSVAFSPDGRLLASG